MTDKDIAEFIVPITKVVGGDLDKFVIEVFKDGQMGLLEKERATQYRLKQDNAIIVEMPRLSRNSNTAIAQIALAVGRRLERFERGAKANAGRTIDSRRKIAQNAIKKRWSAN